MPSLTTVAREPAAAVASGWWPGRLPPSLSFDSSYVAKYSACAGLQQGIRFRASLDLSL